MEDPERFVDRLSREEPATYPTLLMAKVRTPLGKPPALGEPEAEPVLVAQTSSEVILVLDDGEELRFDQAELREALK